MAQRASIVKGIDSLAMFVKNLNFKRIHKQSLPTKYKPNELAIRYIDSDSVSESGYHYRLDRDFQIIYFGKSEKECIEIVSELDRLFNGSESIRLKDSTRHMRIGSFSTSQTFRTEEDGVFGVLGILTTSVRVAREFPQEEKMKEITFEIK